MIAVPALALLALILCTVVFAILAYQAQAELRRLSQTHEAGNERE